MKPPANPNQNKAWKVFLAVLLFVLITPACLSILSSLKAAIFLTLGIAVMLVVLSVRNKIPSRWHAWVLPLVGYAILAICFNAASIVRPANVWQVLTLSGGMPWMWGHSIALTAAIVAFFLLLQKKDIPLRLNSEEILSGPQLISMAEAQKKVRLQPGEKTLFWAGLHLPYRCATEHFAVVGTPGSGKSLTLQLLMKSILPNMHSGSHMRAMIYDAKRDTMKLLSSLFRDHPNPPYICNMNPFDARSCPWDMASDIQDGATAYEVAKIFLPESNESQPFFRNAGRNVLAGVMQALGSIAPGAWTLRDVVYILQSKQRLIVVLNSCVETSDITNLWPEDPRLVANILSTIESLMKPLSFVAAAWHHNQNPAVSIEAWASSSMIVVLGSDPKFDAIMQPLNRVIFKRMVELVRMYDDVSSRVISESWFIIDELRNAGNLEDLDKLLVEGRSKGACVAIGFQDIAGLREVFGEKRADEIIGTCGNKVFLQSGEGTTIDYATKHFKSQEILETKTSQNYTQQHQVIGGYSQSQNKTMRPVVHEGLLKALPKPQRGLQGVVGYCDTAAVGTDSPYLMDISCGFLDAELPRLDDSILGLERKMNTILPPWNEDDLRRLNLLNYANLLLSNYERRTKSDDSDTASYNIHDL